MPKSKRIDAIIQTISAIRPKGDDYLEVSSIPGHVFVVGDNRHNSRDSRFIGPVPAANIVGSAAFIHWSRDLDRIGQRL